MLWTLVALYTLVLPHIILIYNSIANRFSIQTAQKIPIAIIILLGIAYFIAVIVLKKGIKALALLIPCILIVWVFISMESNPNKYIHIPEYILMTWILFEALVLDYKGKGLFILVFVCAAMLGIIDEIMQGMLPNRFFGLKDMIMNAAAALIGIFTLVGLRKAPAGGWTWSEYLKGLKPALGIIIMGTAGAVLTCVCLFRVKAHPTFRDVYPNWLSAWNASLIVAGPVIVFFQKRLYKTIPIGNNEDLSHHDQTITARLWILCPLAILIIMHALALIAAVAGTSFN